MAGFLDSNDSSNSIKRGGKICFQFEYCFSNKKPYHSLSVNMRKVSKCKYIQTVGRNKNMLYIIKLYDETRHNYSHYAKTLFSCCSAKFIILVCVNTNLHASEIPDL
jgi:hypothetical protein